MLRLLRWFTVEQWRQIDQDHRRAETDWRALLLLATIALALVVPHYYGGARHFEAWDWPKRAFAGLAYPTLHPHLYWAAFKTVNYFLLPVLWIKLVARDRIRDYGLTGSAGWRLWVLYGALLAGVLVVAYVASGSAAFMAKYPKYPDAGKSVAQLFLWEAAYAYQFVLLEFFFRGFSIFALARYFGHAAIFIMIIPYAMIHFGKPLAETLGSIVTGIALGTLALRTRSIFGGVVLHVSIGWSMDLFVLWRKGALERLFG